MGRGVGVTEALHGLPEWVVDLFAVLTLLGDWLVIVPLLAVLYLADIARTLRRAAPSSGESLCTDRTVFVIATVFGGLSLILLLESLFGLSRPPEELHAVSPSEYGFPSGHTMAATVFWGALALWSSVGRARFRFVVATAAVAVVGLSRLVLGVHFLVDIIAAAVFGGAYLFVIDRFFRDRPAAVFGLATAIAVGAAVSTGGDSRALLAVAGTISAAVGWRVVEMRPARRFLVKATAPMRN